MTREQIYQRQNLLETVQKWGRINNALTAGQRICLSQERAALLRCLAALDEDRSTDPEPGYRLPPVLEEKVRHIHRTLNNRAK